MATAASSGLELGKPLLNPNGSVTAPQSSPANVPASSRYAPAPTTAPPSDGKPADVPDAGLRGHDHYKRALPKWRYNLRKSMLPLIRWETPYLAYAQSLIRTPMLDSYFAITANLGTHTFFMISLPIMFWCGFPWFGKGLVHVLAEGVFFTGFIKDLLSLPRPLSPPLHRITMSGSAALEYGFPSTHSANSVSVAAYVLLLLRSPTNPFGDATRLTLEVISYCYAASIVLGRLYCGMHGFLDVIIGSGIGIALGVAEYYWGPPLDESLVASSWLAPFLIAVVIIVLVRLHPEPADDCPCVDDSIAFAGVMIGVEFGTWRFSRSAWDYVLPSLVLHPSSSSPSSPDLPADPFATASALGWPKMAARVTLGVLVVFAWREVMKPLLLHALPPLFRLFETQWAGLGIHMPRRFFTTATNYKNIPSKLRMDTVIPNVSDIPDFLSSFKHPGRGRSVSVGPQSAADAYETLAYRERRRRESAGSNASLRSKGSLFSLREDYGGGAGGGGGGNSIYASNAAAVMVQQDEEGGMSGPEYGGAGERYQRHQSPLEMYEQQMGQGHVQVVEDGGHRGGVGGGGAAAAGEGGSGSGGGARQGASIDEPEIYISQENELGEREVFSRLVRPRIRYDVEVVTKLVVYAGIGWLSTDIIPVLFEYVGLGMSHYK